MNETNSWLLQWLDSYLIKSPAQAKRVLQQDGALETLREAAAEAPHTLPSIDNADRYSIVAGANLDLSGRGSCIHPECLKKEVDRLLSTMWYYFDRIVVVGPPASSILRDSKRDPRSTLDTVLGYIEVLLYLRNIGAEPLLVFVDKPDAFCEEHFAEHFAPLVANLGFKSTKRYKTYINQLISRFEAEASIEVHTDKGYHMIVVDYPEYLDQPSGWLIRDGGNSAIKLDKREAAARFVHNQLTLVVADLATTVAMELPLGTAWKFHDRILRSTPRDIEVADVALELELPVLHGVDLETLLKIRTDERDSFLAFRNSLKSAIRERLDASGTTDAKTVAQEIQADLIEPSLNEIDRKLKAARNVLAKKAVVGLGVGTLTTTCGLLTTNPLMVTTGIAAAMSSVPATQKYIEERRDIGLSDMYFLWRAQNLANQ
jgi:hypothetical protein